MADAIEVKLDLKSDGKEAVEELLKKIKEVEEGLGKNTTAAAGKLKQEFKALREEVLKLGNPFTTGKKSVEALTKRIEDAKKSISALDTEGSNVATTIQGIAKGDLTAIETGLTTAIGKTKVWNSLIAKNGAGKMGVALGAIGFAISSIISYGKKWLSQEQQITREMEKQTSQQQKQAADMLTFKQERFEKNQGWAKERREIETGTERAIRANTLSIAKSGIDTQTTMAKAGTTSERQRERLQREAERRKSELDMAEAEKAQNDVVSDAQFKKSQEDAKMSKLKEQAKKLEELRSQATKRTNGVMMGDTDWKYMKQLADQLGLGSYADDEETIRNDAAEQEKYIQELKRKVADQIKEQEIAQKKADSSLATALDGMNVVRSENAAKRAELSKTDTDAERNIAFENEQKRFELIEEQRKNNEADIENKNAYLDLKSTFAEKQARLDQEILRHEKMMADERKKFDASAKGRDYSKRDEWSKEDRRDAERARSRIQEEIGNLRNLRKEKLDAERQGDTSSVAADRTIQLEARKRMEDDIDALNKWNEKMGGELVGQANVNRTYSRRRSQYKKAQQEENRFVAEMRKKYGIGAGVDMQSAEAQARMTQAEKDRFANLHADTLDYRSQMRTAGFDKLGTEVERRGKVAEWMIGAQQQGNRLTRMGLGSGGDGVDFSKSTAQNTKELVSLTKQMLREMGVDTKKIAADGWGI